ncbi:MAG: glucose-6-phosphate isomerase, partial [Oxalobacteraceae bacterium]
MSQAPLTRAEHALSEHHRALGSTRMRDLFVADAKRFDRFSASAGPLFLDYSKNIITQETMQLLGNLVRERGVFDLRDAMFRGDKINVTEKRAVLHTALRAPRDQVIEVDGHNIVPDVHAVLDQMRAFSSA